MPSEVNPLEKSTCDRLVAFIDIMGFKDYVSRKSHMAVGKTLLDLINTIKPDVAETIAKAMEVTYDKSTIKTVIFSDSIIMVSKDNSLISAASLMLSVQWFIDVAFSIGIPFKGAIAYGLFTADDETSLYFGQPLIDAYNLQNDLELYGVVMHCTTEQYLLETGFFDTVINLFNNVKVPTSRGHITHYIINPYLISPSGKDPYKDVLIRYYQKVSGITRRYVDNTADFLEIFKPK